jgi:alkylation response protein AidB-like acyl-CoA dehydrogenase
MTADLPVTRRRGARAAPPVRRDLATERIAPHAAEVDENAFRSRRWTPWWPATCTRHPRGHGGSGADALATVIVIEEVARACASSS